MMSWHMLHVLHAMIYSTQPSFTSNIQCNEIIVTVECSWSGTTSNTLMMKLLLMFVSHNLDSLPWPHMMKLLAQSVSYDFASLPIPQWFIYCYSVQHTILHHYPHWWNYCHGWLHTTLPKYHSTIAPNVSNKPDITHGEIVGTSAGLYVTILILNDEINVMVCYTLTHHNEKNIVIVCYT